MEAAIDDAQHEIELSLWQFRFIPDVASAESTI
jgi:hypothetical protein